MQKNTWLKLINKHKNKLLIIFKVEYRRIKKNLYKFDSYIGDYIPIYN